MFCDRTLSDFATEWHKVHTLQKYSLFLAVFDSNKLEKHKMLNAVMGLMLFALLLFFTHK